MMGCGKVKDDYGVSYNICGNDWLCEDCLSGKERKANITPQNPHYIRNGDFKGLYLYKKRLKDLPLVIVCINNNATYRLCRFFIDGYYYKYVCFGLSATALKQINEEILKV